MKKILDAGYAILETALNVEDLEKAQEVFLTNASYGIRWVKQFRDTIYTNSLTQKIYKELL
jgi:branched-chain amino acid aminotransferase